MEHFNKLTPAEAERLAHLVEELGEATQAIGKILSHGYESKHPDGGPTNREQLETEIGHIHAHVNMLLNAGDIKAEPVNHAIRIKHNKVKKYLHHQEAE